MTSYQLASDALTQQINVILLVVAALTLVALIVYVLVSKYIPRLRKPLLVGYVFGYGLIWLWIAHVSYRW
jgi:preprotein translocase subunit SecF